MLFERTEYREQEAVAEVLEKNVFRHCQFSGFSFEGGHIDAAFLGCTFTRLDWYWGVFKECLFVESRFVKCIFRGTAFPGCKFVECQFIDCEFVEDDQGKACSALGAHVYATLSKGGKGGEFLFAKAAL
jgi:uncharacterized protein YjbI with pentapeptide repeats